LKLYRLQEYEDERLRDHAIELLDELNKALGDNESDENVSDEDWEDEEGSSNSEDDEDEDMEDE